VFQFGSQGLHAGPSTYAFEAAPVVVDGIMYCSGWDGLLWAIDAKTGNLLWQYKHAIPFDVSLCCGNVNRGVAVGHGKVFMATLNAHVVAIDAETGEKVWDTVHGDVRAGESATVAPLLVKDMVIVGSSGGEFGTRGHLDAYNVETGERVWRCYMIPKPGEPGSETWAENGEAWQRGGGNCWVTGTFDPDTNNLYWGTGNPAPDFDGEVRPGDNLFTDSVVAVDVDTGEKQWHYQCTPHDLWDYDSNMECILFEKDGRKCLAHFDKNGYCFILDRTNGELVSVTPFVDRITWGEISPDGKVTPNVYPEKEGEEVFFFPGPAGAKEWTHACFNPQTELFYVPVQDTGSTVARRRREFKEGIPYWGAAVAVDSSDMRGSITAFDTDGKEVWRWENNTPMCASVLTTAGGLVFAGAPEGIFHALDAETGEHLWQFQCGSGHHSSPTTYSVDGRQYVAVPVGWGAWVEGFLPGLMGGPHGSGIFGFALPEE
jgi:alcohol dehydrogenase (cytochrome c)